MHFILQLIVPRRNVKSARWLLVYASFSDLRGLTLLAEGVYSVALRPPGPQNKLRNNTLHAGI